MVYVVRTQRAAFQEWVDGAPWAAPGQVTVVLAGDLAKLYQLVPSEALAPDLTAVIASLGLRLPSKFRARGPPALAGR